MDIEDAIRHLERNGYYRLSAYWYPFRKLENGIRSDCFLKKSAFDDVIQLYVFDKYFKFLLMDAIECIEIALRVDVACLIGGKNPTGYVDPAFFRESFVKVEESEENDEPQQSKHGVWLERFNERIKHAKDEFAKHYQEKYDLPMPIWIAIELWDFGLLSRIYGGMKDDDRNRISEKYLLSSGKILANWLQCFNYIRNIIAHHGRLWNSGLVENLKLPSATQLPSFEPLKQLETQANRSKTPLELPGKKIYSVCCAISHLMKIINPATTWPQRLVTLMAEFPEIKVQLQRDSEAFEEVFHITPKDMGFFENWQDHEFWR